MGQWDVVHSQELFWGPDLLYSQVPFLREKYVVFAFIRLFVHSVPGLMT